MNQQTIDILTNTVLPAVAVLVVTILHLRSGGKLPLLSAILTALGIQAGGSSPTPAPPAGGNASVQLHIGDGHILAALLPVLVKILSEQPAADPASPVKS